MKQITDNKELRQIQIDILDRVVEFCNSHELQYFLSSGTLLGAVRHKGYIPWDDDIDLYMPRKDYNELVKIFQDDRGVLELKSQGSHNYLYTFAKVCNNRTLQKKTVEMEKNTLSHQTR